MKQAPIFSLQAAIASDASKPDQQLYDELLDDCREAYALGYDTAWFLEHHCSEYNPTPSPLIFAAHVARELPHLNLGTSVLVLPWHHPLRVAGEIAMLTLLSRGKLHIAVGRGTAKSEYEAFGIDMTEARQRLAEGVDIIRLALSGKPFSYEGKIFRIPRPVTLRPRPNDNGGRVQLYGAIGSPSSAGIVADMGVPFIVPAAFPNAMLKGFVDTWRERTAARGGNIDVTLPIAGTLIVADSDEEAVQIGLKYMPDFFRIQLAHYEVDNHPWDDVEGFKQFAQIFGNLKRFANEPAELRKYLQGHFVGSPETVRARIEELAAMGYNHFVLGPTTSGFPKALQMESMRRFAREVAPKLAPGFSIRRGATRSAP